MYEYFTVVLSSRVMSLELHIHLLLIHTPFPEQSNVKPGSTQPISEKKLGEKVFLKVPTYWDFGCYCLSQIN